MSLWVVKNDKGEYFDYDNDCWEAPADGNHVIDKDTVSLSAELHGGHPVELVEKPEPVEVSEDAALWLDSAKKSDKPATVLGDDDCPYSQDELLRAYVNGWKVVKPKRYVLPMDGTIDKNYGFRMYACKNDDLSDWTTSGHYNSANAVSCGCAVTHADLESAPAWVKAIKPVEVTDDDD